MLVPVGGDALHLEPKVVHHRLHRRPPGTEIRSRHLQSRDATVAVVGGVGEAKGLQTGACRLQGGEAGVEGRIPGGAVAVLVGEAALPLLILLVEAADERVEDLLEVGIHSTLGAAEPGEVLVRLRRCGFQISLV